MPCGFSTVLNRTRYSGAMGEKGGTNEHRSKHHHMLFQTFQLFRRFISRGVPVYVRENLGFWHHVSWGFKGPTIKFLGQLLACPMGACDWACNIDASCGGTNPFLSHLDWRSQIFQRLRRKITQKPMSKYLEVSSWLPMEWQNCAAARCRWMLSLGIKPTAADDRSGTLPLPNQESQKIPGFDSTGQVFVAYLPCSCFSPNS